ncbi:MAG: hydrogenase, partial [Planctomycetota bacterium]
AWYSGQHYEQFVFLNRPLGPYWWAFFVMVFCNVVVPQMLWFNALRKHIWVVFIAAIFVNIGMWFERFVIVVTSLHRDFVPGSWDMFRPTWVDMGMLAGSFGLFFTLFLLFCRFLPMVAIAEVKTVLPEAQTDASHRGDYYPAADTPRELRRGHWWT